MLCVHRGGRDQQAMRTLAICADDFGLGPGISEGIARLAHARRITAVSCITTQLDWSSSAALLEGATGEIEIGLHVNLTEGTPISQCLRSIWPRFPSLPRLMARARLGRLPRMEIRTEIHDQLAAFVAAVGHAPAFIDGHQHVHQLPLLRSLVVDMAEQARPLPAVRSARVVCGPGYWAKRWLIENTGARPLARLLARQGLATNAVLLGAYDFRARDYRALMQGWLSCVPDAGALLFCHPGAASQCGATDPIGAARLRELDYLGSDAFPQDLAAAGVRLGSVWQGAAPGAGDIRQTSTDG